MNIILTMLIVQTVHSSQSCNSKMQLLQDKAVLFLHETAWIVAASSTPTSKERKELNRSITIAQDIAQHIVKSRKNINEQEVRQWSSKFKNSEKAICALCAKQASKVAR